MKKIMIASIACVAALYGAESDIEALKTQMHMQQEVIEKLQHRVEELERRDLKKQERELDARIERAESFSGSFDQSAFLPSISLIADMSVLGRNVGNEAYENYEIPGFLSNPGEIPFNPKRGFNLNYGELGISATVGPYFDVDSAFHIEKDGLHIGELYVTTRTLPYHLRLKAGKFKSEFGVINAKHQHAWNFTNIPLVFETFFGPGGLGDEGAQVQWVAPTENYLMAGVEAMQGSNGRSFGDTDKISLWTVDLKRGAEFGESGTAGAGLTYMRGRNPHGVTHIYGGDLTFKTLFGSYSALTWQSELLYRDKEGTGDQAGLYTELIYDYDRQWAGGARYDLLFKNVGDLPEDLDRYTVMLQYRPFEFSKLRLQYTYDRSKWIEGDRKDIQELLLGLTIEAGSHGAHAF